MALSPGLWVVIVCSVSWVTGGNCMALSLGYGW